MRKLLIGLGVLALILVVAVLALPRLIATEGMESRIEQAATEALGRQVTIDGPPVVRLFPTSLLVQGLTVANAEGFDAPYLARVGEANVGVKLLPLLSQTIEITRFDLDRPDINLEARPDGEANWVLGPEQPAEEAEGGALPDLRLGTVRIEDGTITYDGGTGRAYEVTEADVTLRLPSLDDVLEAEGTMLVEGRPSRLDATLSTPRSLTEDGTAALTIDAAVGENAVVAELTLGEDQAFGGTLDVDVPALRDLMALAGAEPPSGPGFERAAFSGEVAGNPERLVFAEGTTIAFDAIEGTGNLTVDMSGEVPAVTGAVATGVLDLRPYLPEPEERPEGAPFPDWSEEPIDLSALTAANADLRFAADAILLPQLSVGRSEAALSLQGGRMAMTLDRMALYDGQGSGTLTVDASRAAPRIDAEFDLTGVSMGAFAADAAGITRLRGTGDVTLDLTTSGDSQAAYVRNLSGTMRTALGEGAIEGVNLGAIARSALGAITQLREGGLNVASLAGTLATAATEARAPGEETDFSSLLVEADLAQGVATSRTIRLDGPYYEVTGDAVVDLPEQSVRMTLNLAVSAPGADTRRELIAPILVSGTFSDPKIGVDAEPLARQAAGSVAREALGRVGLEVGEGETVEDAVRNRATDALGGLLGGGRPAEAPVEEDEEPAEEGEPEEDADPIADALGGLFGGGRRD